MSHVANDTDHTTATVLGHDLPDRILARPKSLCQRLVDNDNRFARRRVPFGEVASGAKRNTHRLKVSFTHNPDETLGMVTSFIDHSLRPYLPTSIAPQGEHIGQSRSL